MLAHSRMAIMHGSPSRLSIFGMTPSNALKAATSIAGQVLNMDIGVVKAGMFADLIAVDDDPTKNISASRRVKFVMKGDAIYKR